MVNFHIFQWGKMPGMKTIFKLKLILMLWEILEYTLHPLQSQYLQVLEAECKLQNKAESEFFPWPRSQHFHPIFLPWHPVIFLGIFSNANCFP